MKNVSVLGCGWLGKPLAISFLEDGFTVKGSTTSEEKLDDLRSVGIEPYLVNISEFEEFDDFLNTDILIIAITSKVRIPFLMGKWVLTSESSKNDFDILYWRLKI